MANGRTVKLDGLGTFYYIAASNGNGVEIADKVNATQITGVRVRFIPETHQNSSHQVTTRSLVSTNIFWEEWGGKDSLSSTSSKDAPGEVCENSFWNAPREVRKNF